MDTTPRPSFEEMALRLADVIKERSEDPNLKVGCCILRHDNSVASLGYNGAPPGVTIDWDDRIEKRQRVIHAEKNALRYIKPGECKLVAVTTSPCGDCLTNVRSYGITRIAFYDRFRDFDEVQIIATDLGVELVQYPRPVLAVAHPVMRPYKTSQPYTTDNPWKPEPGYPLALHLSGSCPEMKDPRSGQPLFHCAE